MSHEKPNSRTTKRTFLFPVALCVLIAGALTLAGAVYGLPSAEQEQEPQPQEKTVPTQAKTEQKQVEPAPKAAKTPKEKKAKKKAAPKTQQKAQKETETTAEPQAYVVYHYAAKKKIVETSDGIVVEWELCPTCGKRHSEDFVE